MASSNPSFGDWMTDRLRFTGTSEALPVVALGGLALGAGGRLVKNLVDLYRRPPEQTAAGIGAMEQTYTDVPIEVTEEEAEELRKRGVKVRRLMQKVAAWGDVDPSFLGGMAYGALGTGTTMLGWKLVDYLVDRARKKAVKDDIKRTRKRIRSLLEASPQAMDVPAHAFMKAAEDLHFEFEENSALDTETPMTKEAAIFPGWLKALGGGLLGSGALLAGIGAYRKAMRSSPVRGRLSKIKEAIKNRFRGQPAARMAPYYVERLDPEEERRKSYDELAAKLRARRAAPVVVAQSGSPATQARNNAQAPTRTIIDEKEEEEEKAPVSIPTPTPTPAPAPAAASADFY